MKRINLYLKIYIIFFLITSLIDFFLYQKPCGGIQLPEGYKPIYPDTFNPLIKFWLTLAHAYTNGIFGSIHDFISPLLFFGLVTVIVILITKRLSGKFKDIETTKLLAYAAFLISIFFIKYLLFEFFNSCLI